MLGVIAGDAFISFLWAFSSSTVAALIFAIKKSLDVHGSVPTQLISTSVNFAFIYTFCNLSGVFGGASFIPTVKTAFYSAGLGNDDLFSMSLRFPAQVIGAVIGASAIAEFMPSGYKHMLGSPWLKVDKMTGAVAEGLLTFLICMVELSVKDSSYFNKAFMLTTVSLLLIGLGANYTGPSMNPAYAFGWAYVNNRHKTWEHFYVYWIYPFVGSILSGWMFRMMFLQ